MPYLHWESDRKREHISKFIYSTTSEYRSQKRAEALKETKERINLRNELPQSYMRENRITHDDDNSPQRKRLATDAMWPLQTMAEVFAKGWRQGRNKGDPVQMDLSGRLRTGDQLGQFLLDAARL